MTTVEESIDVAVPVSTAYNQWTQFESFPQFMGGVESITQTSETSNHWITNIGGVERVFDTEITEQHPDERVAWKSTDGTSHAGVVTFHRLSDTDTRVSVQLDWDPETFIEKVGSVVGADDRQVKSDLKRFKAFIEGLGAETGSWRGNVDAPPTASAPTTSTSASGLAAAPESDPAMDDPESGGPRAGF
ncbi:SRPBCC family protein [Arthrobacter sp. zg-ZUI100]|uniref:SRPBCC family protein n=1 Tax=Arthrobacter jiangjiafuii TaxID=2817475 RepID=UPI001AEE8B8A|nr:SRPBCC family protein [Arthrobacter jiangjiafuii]